MISIIIPAHNPGRSIARCIASLRDQSVPASRCEIIVVDDGSTDGAIDALEGVAVIRQPNRGPGAARNAGAALARGEILLFIDADCEADRRWVETMVAPFADPAVVASYGAYGTRQREVVAQFAQLEFEERYDKLGRSDTIDFIASHAVAFRHRAFTAAGGFDAGLRMNEDVDLGYRIAEAGGKMKFVPEAIIYHRHPSTVKSYVRTKFWRGYWRSLVYCGHPRKALSDTYTPQTLKLQSLLACATAGSLAAGAAFPGMLGMAAGCAVAGTLTMLPFMARALRKSPRLALASVGMLWLRAGAIGSGAATGFTATAGRRLAGRAREESTSRAAERRGTETEEVG